MGAAQEGKPLKCSSLGRFENHLRKHFEERLEEQEWWEICMGEILGWGKGRGKERCMWKCASAKDTQNRATRCMTSQLTAVPQKQESTTLTPGTAALGCCPVKWPLCEVLVSQQTPCPESQVEMQALCPPGLTARDVIPLSEDTFSCE